MNKLVPKYRIKINGQDLAVAAPVANSAIERLLFEEAFFRTSHVEITLQDALGFDLLPDMIDPTKNPILELFLGYHPNPTKVFEGHIVEMEPSGDQSENPKLRLKAYDYSWLLKVPREPTIYSDTNLHSIVSKLIKRDRSGLSLTPVIDPAEPLRKFTADNYRSVNQIDMTDWELLSKAARLVGHKLYCRFKEVHIEDKNQLEAMQGDNIKTFIYKPRKGQIDNETTFRLLAFNPML
jgi:phage protein D